MNSGGHIFFTHLIELVRGGEVSDLFMFILFHYIFTFLILFLKLDLYLL